MSFELVRQLQEKAVPVDQTCRLLEVSRSGYLYKMFLPGASGIGIEEDPTSTSDVLPVTQDSDLAETSWCAYAWPANYSTSGNRSFFVNQTGDITSTDDSDYSGTGDIDDTTCGNAFVDGGSATAPTDDDADEQRQVAATVRYCLVPKLKKKSPKKAKRALRAADCTPGKVKRTKKERRKKQVLSQSVKPGTAISDTAAVNIKISRKR